MTKKQAQTNAQTYRNLARLHAGNAERMIALAKAEQRKADGFRALADDAENGSDENERSQ